jgi:hypothetical protein
MIQYNQVLMKKANLDGNWQSMGDEKLDAVAAALGWEDPAGCTSEAKQ